MAADDAVRAIVSDTKRGRPARKESDVMLRQRHCRMLTEYQSM